MDVNELTKQAEIITDEIQRKTLQLESESGFFAAGKRKKLGVELQKLYTMLAEIQAKLITEQEKIIEQIK